MHIRPKKSLGQNFLADPSYLRRIVEAARIRPEEQVLEIGPGLGHLTAMLAPVAGRLLIIELDDRLLPELRRIFNDRSRIEIVHADALEFDYGQLTGTWKVVANLPYYISTPLIERLLRHQTTFATFTLMLQREVAERIASPPGTKEYGVLSVLVQYRAVPRIAFPVPAGAFTPRPKVDSAVITLTLRSSPEHPVQDERFFERVVKSAFGQRRKTLRNSLGAMGYSRTVLETTAALTGIDLTRRPETLSIREFTLLANALFTQPIEKQMEK